MSKIEREPLRVSKREFTARFARRAGVPVRVATQVYDAMIDELLEIVGMGDTVTLTGFGKFYPQKHKGHAVRFADDQPEVEDYAVLKFSATRAVNRSVKVPPERKPAPKTRTQTGTATKTRTTTGSK